MRTEDEVRDTLCTAISEVSSMKHGYLSVAFQGVESEKIEFQNNSYLICQETGHSDMKLFRYHFYNLDKPSSVENYQQIISVLQKGYTAA